MNMSGFSGYGGGGYNYLNSDAGGSTTTGAAGGSDPFSAMYAPQQSQTRNMSSLDSASSLTTAGGGTSTGASVSVGVGVSAGAGSSTSSAYNNYLESLATVAGNAHSQHQQQHQAHALTDSPNPYGGANGNGNGVGVGASGGYNNMSTANNNNSVSGNDATNSGSVPHMNLHAHYPSAHSHSRPHYSLGHGHEYAHAHGHGQHHGYAQGQGHGHGHAHGRHTRPQIMAMNNINLGIFDHDPLMMMGRAAANIDVGNQYEGKEGAGGSVSNGNGNGIDSTNTGDPENGSNSNSMNANIDNNGSSKSTINDNKTGIMGIGAASPVPGYTNVLQQPQGMNGSHTGGLTGYAAIDATTNNYIAHLRQQQQQEQNQQSEQQNKPQTHNTQAQHQKQQADPLLESFEINGVNMNLSGMNTPNPNDFMDSMDMNMSMNGMNMDTATAQLLCGNPLDHLNDSTTAAMNALAEDSNSQQARHPHPQSLSHATKSHAHSMDTASSLDGDDLALTSSPLNPYSYQIQPAGMMAPPATKKKKKSKSSRKKVVPKPKDILADFKMTISSLSITPLSASEILAKVKMRSREVILRYLPCVEFLVLCQQELRQALNMVQNTRGHGRGRSMMSTGDFYNTYFSQLPQRFYARNEAVMPMKELTAAYQGLEKLLGDVKKMERTGKHEGMKNAFLGGMRDGESWGLRKWLSKNGGALHICNDIELIWGGLRDLNKEDAKTIELAKRIRPESKKGVDRLKADVPKAYQEVSTAHPYLPFFHRLESCLKGLSEFDPEDDDVICLDDDSDIEEVVTPAPVASSSAKLTSESSNKDTKSVYSSGASSNGPSAFKNNAHKSNTGDDSDSDLEIVDIKGPLEEGNEAAGFEIDPGMFEENENSDEGWRCHICTYTNSTNTAICVMCDTERVFDEISGDSLQDGLKFDDGNAQQLAEAIETIASALEEGEEIRPADMINPMDFWSNPVDNYILLLRLFQRLLLHKAAKYLLDPVANSEHFRHDSTRYYELVKNPLSFRDIVISIADSEANLNGRLQISTLKKWNMFEGKYFIQAMDLVFLNILAFIGKETTPMRKEIQALRKLFWKQIREVGCEKKQVPIRRTENSDFLIRKKKK